MISDVPGILSYVLDEAVDKRVTEEYIKAGYFKQNPEGAVVKDEDKMRAKAFAIVSGAVVNSKAERNLNSVTNGELYIEVFPEGPGVNAEPGDEMDALEQAVRIKLKRNLWTLTNPAAGGWIQKKLGAASTLVLCRGSVWRDQDEVAGVFVTNDPQLILSDSLAPNVEKLVRVANDLRKHAGMITERHPELAARVGVAIDSGVTRVKVAAQLTAGNGTSGPGESPDDSNDDASTE